MGCMSKAQFTCAVVPQYLEDQSNPVRHEYAFAYTVTIVNSGDVPAQLIGRHWIITDATGRTEEVRGLGVVGHQPLLKPGERFEYTSWTRLATPRGAPKLRSDRPWQSISHPKSRWQRSDQALRRPH